MLVKLKRGRTPYFDSRCKVRSELTWLETTDKPLCVSSELPLHHRIRNIIIATEDEKPKRWVQTWCNRWIAVDPDGESESDKCETACDLCEQGARKRRMVPIKELVGADVALATGRQLIKLRVARRIATEESLTEEMDDVADGQLKAEPQQQSVVRIKAPTAASLLAALIRTPGDSLTISMPNADKYRKFEYLQSSYDKANGRQTAAYNVSSKSMLSGLRRLLLISRCLICGERVCHKGKVTSKKGAYHAECLIRKAEDAGD